MAVIDEKLTRMKELAEQAATGTYTTLQREIINSEYQAMAKEIDRIATATNFNGVKLLDGSITNLHGGQGMKIHFGVGNNADEDYYFINTGDVRATSNSGLRIGGDAKNDIWGQGAAGSTGLAGPGCCTAGYDSLDGNAGFKSGDTFAYGYNWDWMEDDDPDLLTGKYLAGRYQVNSSESLQDLINKVNKGTQSRVGIKLDGSAIATAIKEGGTAAVCIGDEAYVFGSAAVAGGTKIIPAVSGIVYQHLATGSYQGQGFQVNSATGYGFGLTLAQMSALQAAGLDISALHLASAIVSSSGSSTVTSAQAKGQLLTKLASLWTSLNLESLSGITISASAVTGFTISSTTITASAGATTLVGTGVTATIDNDQTLTVHTGVYADVNGNWTDDKALASALQLEEIVFHFTNQNSPYYQGSLTSYTSPDTFVNNNNQVVSLTTQTALTAAGLTGLANSFTAATVSGPFSTIDSNRATASAALQQQVEDAWKAKYTGLYTLSFTAGATITAGAFGPADANALVATTTYNTTDQVANGTPLTYTYSNLWTDGTGNWTSSQTLATQLSWTNLRVTVTNDGSSPNYIFSTNAGTTFTQPTVATTTDIAGLLTTFQDLQGNFSLGTGAKGQVSLATTTTNPFPPTAAQVDAVRTFAQVNPTASSPLLVTMDGALTQTIPVSLTTLARDTTTVADLVTQVGSALTALLTGAQTVSTSPPINHVGSGRILRTKATAPPLPSSNADVTNPTMTSSFYSGVLDKSVATGAFSDSGFMYSSSVGYGLTSAQYAALLTAGVDLNKLLLASAIVSGSAFSTVSSASARQNLVTKLAELWTALKLGDLSAITISAGDYASFTPLTADDLITQAGVGVLNGVGGTATINEQQTLVVHTGIYADGKGNWTQNATLAADLGLQEVTYTISNNDYTWTKQTLASWENQSFWTSGSYILDSAFLTSLPGTFTFSPATTGYVRPSIANVSASGVNATAVSAQLEANVNAAWAAKYPTNLEKLVFSPGENANALADLTLANIIASANNTNATGIGPTDHICAGQSLNIHTGYYADTTAGVWTDSASIASALGLTKEIVFTVTNTAGTYSVVDQDGNALAGSPYTPLPTSLTFQDFTPWMANAAKTYMSELVVSTGGGRVELGGNLKPTAPSAATVEPLKSSTTTTTNTVNTALQGLLQGTANVSGIVVDVFDGTPPPPIPPGTLTTATDMNTLAAAINDDIDRLLYEFYNTYGYPVGLSGGGKLLKGASTAPNAPTTLTQLENVATTDTYKEASGQQTVTTTGFIDKYKFVTLVASAGTAYTNASGVSNFGAWALASAINHNPNSQFWAMIQPFDSNGNTADMVYVFAKEGGDLNSILACDVADGDIPSQDAIKGIEFENTESGKMNQDGTNLSLGGQNWATFKPVQTRAGMGKEVWNLTLNGRDVGKERDLWIAAVTDGKNEVNTPGLTGNIINGLDRYSFVEIQNADNGPWVGAEVRTQSSAQEALDALNDAMERKDKVRADIGALQNRLENTITNLEIQVEALQASESRISDADLATEMTEFVRNQVLAQAAVAMLSQANSLPQMALSLLNG
jgi:flagellin-like hook-associated protein FlgL